MSIAGTLLAYCLMIVKWRDAPSMIHDSRSGMSSVSVIF